MQFTTFLAFTMTSLVISAIAVRADELYQTRPRAIGTGLGGAWLRLGSSRVRIFVGWVARVPASNISSPCLPMWFWSAPW